MLAKMEDLMKFNYSLQVKVVQNNHKVQELDRYDNMPLSFNIMVLYQEWINRMIA